MTEHFHDNEFRCKCCKGLPKAGISPRLFDKLEHLREAVSLHLGKETPLIVLSGYRCKKHNEAVGGVPNSYHVQGKAADIKLPDRMTFGQFRELCLKVGITRIGLYHDQRFVHVDVGEEPKHAIWEE